MQENISSDPARITALYTYPVKSCAPIAMNTSSCSKIGLPFDRNYVTATKGGDKIYTQRDLPELATIQPVFIDENTLGLSRSGDSPIVIPGTEDGSLVRLNVWGNDYFAVDQGEDIARWLSSATGVSCRLFRRADVESLDAKLHQDHTRYDAAFVDCCPLSIVFEHELETLNGKLVAPVPMSRFRPSIVVSGLSQKIGNAEQNISVGTLQLAYIRPVGRCVIINVDQERGCLAGTEPLKVLAGYNLVNNKAALGHYYVAENTSVISVGDVVTTNFMTPD